MNEQWNNALDQVKDEYLSEAVSYRPKRHWPKVVGAVAAVLVLAVGWSILRPTPSQTGTTGGIPSDGIAVDGAAPGSPQGNFGDALSGGNHQNNTNEDTPGAAGSSPPIVDQPDYQETLHYDTYEEFRTACLEDHRWYIHDQVMIPLFDGKPMVLQSISVFEQEMYYLPWVWYFASSDPHITIRIPTTPSLSADMAPDISGAEALRQIFPSAPNLHNREEYTDNYSEIREVEIITAEGVKTALYRLEADRDRAYLTFLQNGTLVTVAGPGNILLGDWLETFSLMPIDVHSERSCL